MLLIGNGRVITRDQENPYLEDGAVVISGEKIKEVGSLTEMKAKYPEAEFVDAKGGVIMQVLSMRTHISTLVLQEAYLLLATIQQTSLKY